MPSTAGSLSNVLVRAFDIRAGNVLMYFPEANVLVPTTTDPQSRTPAFKSVLVTVNATVTKEDEKGRRALPMVRA